MCTVMVDCSWVVAPSPVMNHSTLGTVDGDNAPAPAKVCLMSDCSGTVSDSSTAGSTDYTYSPGVLEFYEI